MALRYLLAGAGIRKALVITGFFLVGLLGYLPWRYAAIYETCRVDFSPLFSSELCTTLGFLLKTLALMIWVGGAALCTYLLFKKQPLKQRGEQV